MNNPWKGLNFYKEGEILYGRSLEIETLAQFILANTQTVIYGKSGIGKTSILNAGIFPKVRAHGLLPIAIRLEHNSADSYLKQIKAAILKAGAMPQEIVPVIDAEKETMWEYLHRHTFHNAQGEAVRLMFVFDQFEEIFTLQRDEHRKLAFFEELADLLNDVTPQYITRSLAQKRSNTSKGNEDDKKLVHTLDDINLDFIDSATTQPSDENTYLTKEDFHMVFVLREDFLSYLERYTIYIPVMKSNRFALLPLNEEQAAEIICQPRPGLVDTNVAELIIRKVTGRQDFTLDGIAEIEVDAAMLSLYLSRLYDKRPTPDSPITAELVDQFGNDIINDFYEESVADIPADIVHIIEDELLTYDGRRNNVSRRDLVQIGVPENVVKDLVENKKLLRQFSYAGDMRIEYMHDTLCKVVQNRIEQREAAAEIARKEAEQKRIAAEREHQLQLSQERELQLRKRNRKMLIAIILGILLLLGGGFLSWYNWQCEISERYGVVVKQNGFFKGLEPLSKDEASYRERHYVLYYKGWRQQRRNRPFKMEARDGYHNLTTDTGFAPYILNQYRDDDEGADKKMKELLWTVCQWEFVTDRTGSFVVQERALNTEGGIVYTFNRSKTDKPNKVLSTYMDEFGFPIVLRDSIYIYLLTTYDENGYEIQMEFYDDKGYPVPNRDGAFQTKWEYLSNGIAKAEYSCFLDGNRMIDRAGNCGWNDVFGPDSIHQIYGVSLDPQLKPCRVMDDSIFVRQYKYDEHYRVIEQSYFFPNGQPDVNNEGIHKYIVEYNRHGQRLACSWTDINGQPCASKKTGKMAWRNDYDQWGNRILTEDIYQDSIEGKSFTYLEDGTQVEQVEYTIYISENGQLDTIYTFLYHFDPEQRIETSAWEDAVRKKSFDEKMHQTSYSWFDVDGITPIVPYGYHTNKTTYEYKGDTTIICDLYYDRYGNILYNLNNYYNTMIIVDSLNYSKLFLYSFSPNTWSPSHRNVYSDNTFTHVVSQESINQLGVIKRTYSANACYYRANLLYPIKPLLSEQLMGWTAENEFGEPSVMYYDSKAYSAMYTHNEDTLYFNDDGQIIDPNSYIWSYIAFADIKNYEQTFGFKDGDILLACNNAYYKHGYSDEFLRVYNSKTERDIIVARYYPESNVYDTVHVLLTGDMEMDGNVNFSVQYCTEKEKQRIDSIVYRYFYKQMVYGVPLEDTSLAAYQSGMDSIYVLSLNEWDMQQNAVEDIIQIIDANRNAHKKMVYWDIPTGKIRTLETDDQAMGIYMSSATIPLEQAATIEAEFKQWKDSSAAE